MKRIFVIIFIISFYSLKSQVQNANWAVIPNPFNEDQEIEVKVSGIDTSKWGVDLV